jgi:hypothetical protein
MIAEGMKDFSPVYSSWLGKLVVMLVVIRQCHVPMPCRIVGESAADVRVCIQPGWEMDVGKDLILAVEEVVIVTQEGVTRPPKASIVSLPARISVGPVGASVAETVSKPLTIFQRAGRLIFTN